MSLVRSLIDRLYNVIAILENPTVKGPQSGKSGLHKTARELDDDQQMHGGQPQWDEYLKERRWPVGMLITTACLLGNISMRSIRRLDWDDRTGTVL